MEKAQKVILTCMCQISNGDEILVLYKVSNSYQVTEMFINNREHLLKRLLDL